MNKNSENIVENLKSRKIKELFQLLDSDHDGLISSKNIDISSIPTFILESIAPLLIEMDKSKIEINLEIFQLALQELFSMIDQAQKDRILLSHLKEKWHILK